MNGLYDVGACGRPASSAASWSLSSFAGLSKMTRAAAWIPTAVWPPNVPYGTLFYLLRIHFLSWTFSSSSASFASWSLRLNVRSLEM